MLAEKCYMAAKLKTSLSLNKLKLQTILLFSNIVLQVKHRN